jgi:hypothetical protein
MHALAASCEELRARTGKPPLVDWFFTQRLESFVKYWLYDTLGPSGTGLDMNTRVEVSIHCVNLLRLL